MNENNFIDSFAAEYFSDDINEKRRCEMEADLKNNKGMQQAIDEYAKLWEKSAHLRKFDKIDPEGDWKSVKKRMGFQTKSKRIPLTKYFLRISALLVLAFGMVYFLRLLVNHVSETSTDYFNVVAQSTIKKVQLPDGSVVTLNKASSIFYNNNFGTENRDVILEGEAFFDVTKNKNLPFKVFVANSTVEVLGTSFNIKADNNKVHLGVVTGHVAFFETANKQNRIELQKNEMVDFNDNNQVFESVIKLNTNTLAWKTGRLEFNNVPMEEVFSEVASFYGKELVLNINSGIAESFTATFDNQSLEEIVEIINIGTKQEFIIEINDNQLVVN
jgi:ferric-dicitrate binding protein FerR (iron transport regulator)